MYMYLAIIGASPTLITHTKWSTVVQKPRHFEQSNCLGPSTLKLADLVHLVHAVMRQKSQSTLNELE